VKTPPTSLPDKLHSRLLAGYADLVAELGGDAAIVARRARLEPREPVDTYRATTRLLEAAAAELDCPDFGLRLGRRQGGGSLGPLSLVMRHSRTLADALAYVAGHSQAHSLAARIWIQRRPAERSVFVGHQILLAGAPSWTQAIEHMLLLGHLGAMEMTAGEARARRVSFRHRPASPLRTYRRHFGCETQFGESEDGIHFGESDFACAIVDTDAEAYRGDCGCRRSFPAKRPARPRRGAIADNAAPGIWAEWACRNRQPAGAPSPHHAASP
jgi:hypothetical protein